MYLQVRASVLSAAQQQPRHRFSRRYIRITCDYLQYHYNGVIMGAIAFQITSLMIVYSIVYSDADQGKHQSSASLAFVRGIHRRPVNSPHKWSVTRKIFPFDDVIMLMWKNMFVSWIWNVFVFFVNRYPVWGRIPCNHAMMCQNRNVIGPMPIASGQLRPCSGTFIGLFVTFNYLIVRKDDDKYYVKCMILRDVLVISIHFCLEG